MIDLLKSLSVGSGAFVVSMMTVIVLLIWTIFLKRRPRWSMALLLPWPFAYVLYWLPVWLGYSGSGVEASAWEMLFVGAWSVIGMVVSSIALIVIKNLDQ